MDVSRVRQAFDGADSILVVLIAAPQLALVVARLVAGHLHPAGADAHLVRHLLAPLLRGH